MRVVITGAAGFLGRKLTSALLAGGELTELGAVETLVLFDAVAPDAPASADIDVVSETGDITDSARLASVVAGADVVFHLAAVVSSAAEEDFELGMRVNFDGTRALLEACRAHASAGVRFVFASSVAVFGGELPAVIRDDTAVTPQSSYGTEKAMAELLVNDYSRRGFVDGRVIRLPTIVVRPGRPNKAASSFASSIIREPLQQETALCPVPHDTRLFVLSPRRVIESLQHAAVIEAAWFGASRTVMLPGITVSVSEMIDALGRAAGEAAVGRISDEPDPGVEAIVTSWPARFETTKGDRLGFQWDRDIDAIIEAFVEDDLAGR
ncbi:D-erythronate dehydrogenase [wastewater metagenome]|uniref:D-erythronate dehydrogenase n=2 Tax=unclassified sequences TaxID=12908 RepID=A0A5B8RCD6_9ZZZZ|nr:D-erythronate dehydrogenase [uncultured organism]